MILGMNAGFGDPLSPHDTEDLTHMHTRLVRTEINPSWSDERAQTIIHPFVQTLLSPLILLCGADEMESRGSDVTGMATHARRCYRLVRDIVGPAGCIFEPLNEPDIHNMTPYQTARVCEAVHRALREDGFEGLILGGSISNTTPKGLAYLGEMNWSRLPYDLYPTIHRYAPANNPKRSHAESLQHEIVGVMYATGRLGQVPAITEMGYHTFPSPGEWKYPPLDYFAPTQLTNAQAAEALIGDLTQYDAWGVPLCCIYQWNNGTNPQFESYGMRDIEGNWLPQGYAVQQFGASR